MPRNRARGLLTIQQVRVLNWGRPYSTELEHRFLVAPQKYGSPPVLITTRSGHGLVVRRNEGGRRSVLFMQVDPVDPRCATHGFELWHHGNQIRMVRGH